METMQIKVAKNSNVCKVAGMIAACIKENKKPEIQTIGASAVNQAVKSIAVARGYLAPTGVNLSCIPAFSSVEIGTEKKASIKFILTIN